MVTTVHPADLPGANRKEIHEMVESGPRGREIETLMDFMRTGEGRREISSILFERLGPIEDRVRKQSTLRREMPEDQPLLKGLVDTMTIPDTREVADEVTRILGVAVDIGTSDAIIRRAIEVVLLMTMRPEAPAARLSSSESHLATKEIPPPEEEEARPSKNPTPPRITVPASASSDVVVPRFRGPRYEPDGPFELPDRPVRFGEFGEMFAAPLLPPSGTSRGGGAVRIPSMLPAPPDTEDPDLVRSWLRGLPAFTDSLAIRAGLLDTGDPGDLMEIEAEFHADPGTALRLYKAARPVADGTRDAAWCARLGRDIGRFEVTHERAVEEIASALRKSILEGHADRRDILARSGAVLVLREELAEAVCGLIDAEAHFILDGPSETSGPPQNLLGSFSPAADLSEARCLERAVFLHFSASVPFGSALRQSLTEFRLAQAMRENPDAPLAALDSRHERDPALPLAELCGKRTIHRIGYCEPALT